MEQSFHRDGIFDLKARLEKIIRRSEASICDKTTSGRRYLYEGTEKVLKGRNNTGGGAAPVINITPIHKPCMGEIISWLSIYEIIMHLQRFDCWQTSTHRVNPFHGLSSLAPRHSESKLSLCSRFVVGCTLCYIISSFQDFFSALFYKPRTYVAKAEDVRGGLTPPQNRVWKTLLWMISYHDEMGNGEPK